MLLVLMLTWGDVFRPAATVTCRGDVDPHHDSACSGSSSAGGSGVKRGGSAAASSGHAVPCLALHNAP